MIERWYDLLDEIDGFLDENRDHLVKRNIDRLRVISLMGLIIFILGMAMSYMVVKKFALVPSFGGVFAVLLAYLISSARLRDKLAQNHRMARVYVVSFYVLMLICLFWVDISVTPTTDPLWFCVGMVALSACYIDKARVLIILEFLLGSAACIYLCVTDGVPGMNLDCLAIMGTYMLSVLCYMMNLNLQADTGSDNRAIKKKSVTDLLTGLLNKIAFEDSCRQFLENRGEDKHCALIILDFDDFKHVNDNYGHQVGDEVLKHFGEILHDSFRVNDILGRVGGDEFMVMVASHVPEEGIAKRCDNILHELAICHLGGSDGFSCSIGIAMDEREAGSDFAQLYAAADQALYRSKENGKAQYQVEHLTD